MSKSYLVTGGTGFLGSALVRSLVKAGDRVRVLDDNSRGSLGRLNDIEDHFEFVQGDIRSFGDVKRAAKGVESICHLAAVNGTEFFYQKPEIVLDVGVRGMINVLDACLAHGIGELFVASSSEVYQTPDVVPTDETAFLSIPDPLNPRYSYAGSKIISELLALNYGRKYFERAVIFRPHNVYGPDMGWEHVIPQFAVRMKQLIDNSGDVILFPIQGTGKETRSFVYVDDFTDGLVLLLDKGEHQNIYHIGTMDEISIEEVACGVGECFGKRIEIIPGEPAKGGTPRRCPDIRKLVALGYSPRVSFGEGLSTTVKWYDENIEKAPDREKV